MQTVVREINEDYQQRLDSIKEAHVYDVLEMSGSRAVWPQVLAVYAVKTTSDLDTPMEVASMDNTRKAILTDIFWQMNDISFRTEAVTETVISETDDGNGNIVETTTTVTQTYLYITVSHKTVEEMADQFGFNKDQREQIAALLEDENNMLWASVLYGIGASDDAIVTVALSQIGNVGGEPYWSWYGFESRVEWCACFVSWCANECGYIDGFSTQANVPVLFSTYWATLILSRLHWKLNNMEKPLCIGIESHSSNTLISFYYAFNTF